MLGCELNKILQKYTEFKDEISKTTTDTILTFKFEFADLIFGTDFRYEYEYGYYHKIFDLKNMKLCINTYDNTYEFHAVVILVPPESDDDEKQEEVIESDADMSMG